MLQDQALATPLQAVEQQVAAYDGNDMDTTRRDILAFIRARYIT